MSVNPLQVLMQLPPEVRQALLQQQAQQQQQHAQPQQTTPYYAAPTPAPTQIPQYTMPAPQQHQAPQHGPPLSVSPPSVARRSEPQAPRSEPHAPRSELKLEQLAKFIMYLHAVHESESLARLLLHLDVDEERLLGARLTDRHRAALESELAQWPRARALRVETLNALVVGCSVLFDLQLGLERDAQPCSADAFAQLDFVLPRDGRLGITKDALVGVHSALVNRSKMVPREIFHILRQHDPHHDYQMRMRRRMRALEGKDSKRPL